MGSVINIRYKRSCIFILMMCVLSGFSCASMGTYHAPFIDGAPIGYVAGGAGSPTVIFEAGLGNGYKSWKPVFNEVAQVTKAVAYSRAGYSGNIYHYDKGRLRTSDDVARMLRKLIDKENIPAPFILVGHSIGGMYVLRFAELYPDEVAGVVLVDGRPRGFSKACEEAGLEPCAPSGIAAVIQPAHRYSEIKGIEPSDELTPVPEQLGDLPVTVIAATKPPKGISMKIQDLWLVMQEEFAQELTNGRYVQAEDAGHFIHHDNPELVAKEILAMVEKVRARAQ